ncbi:DeoR/GlpR family DNA-binding transcription regulator [Pseudoduganella sp. UC29_106]|uniref:DeoR/GlpR family DNA-binding transcription regulator n=1 Tax=Pseudoduganella sp. UC29_106 TaxID=3374553 RepID=UPI003756F052
MLSCQERRALILQTLQHRPKVRVASLAQDLGVSAVTVRGDLWALTMAGLVERQHGGARLARKAPAETSLAEKCALRSERKARIAARAAALVKPSEKLILSAGSTALMLAHHLAAQAPLTIFTNSLPIASALSQTPDICLMLAGGNLRQSSQSMQGSQAEVSLSTGRFDKLFLGADGCDAHYGLSTHDGAEARLNAHMIEHARQVILLADSSRFGQLLPYRTCALERIQTVISDTSLAPDVRATLAARGIEVLIAE